MPIPTINSLASTATPTPTGAVAKDQLNMATFMKLLTAQLQSQDPLNPMSDTEFFAQLAQLGTVQGVDKMQQTMQAGQAAALVGKTVTGVDTSSGTGQVVTGVVNSLNIVNGQYLLNLKGKNGTFSQIEIGNIQSIS